MKKLLIIPFFIACEDKLSSSCDDYVDYICSCHEENSDYDCADLANMYADPDMTMLLECSNNLDSQRYIDEQAQLECEI